MTFKTPAAPELTTASRMQARLVRGFGATCDRDFANPRASIGGKPEPGDADRVDTLVREAAEENQVTVSDSVYLGYQEVHRPGRPPYAQVRMVALIASFEPRRPDPDGRRIYRRL
jgi:8-oxo-dGTP pyrophosphatase MutT (NUDIX family)